MIYNSLFDQFCILTQGAIDTFSRSSWAYHAEYLSFSDSLEGTLCQLSEAVHEKEVTAPELKEHSLITRILHPPRIIRAALDTAIQNPTPPAALCVRSAIDLGLSVYKRVHEQECICHFTDLVKPLRFIWESGISQPRDNVTWSALFPLYSINSAKTLAEKVNGSPVLFIALAHGAVAAGMDVFLRYQSITSTTNSIFHVIRYSRRKHEDNSPHIEDIDYLKSCAKDKTLVFFDEDVTTGKTLFNAANYFRTFFPEQRMILLTNINTFSSSGPILGEYARTVPA